MSRPDQPAGPAPAAGSTRPATGATGPDELGFLFEAVVRLVPEFLPRYLDLAAVGDDDPGAQVVLMELAQFVADRLAVIDRETSVVTRALDLVETHLAGGGDDEILGEVEALAFFDSFTLEERCRLTPRLGPCSTELLESLDLPPDRAER